MTTETNGFLIVQRIDSELKHQKLKRQDLTSHCDIAPNSLANWSSRGSIPSADIAIKIANYLNVSVEWLITGQERTEDENDSQKFVKDFELLPEDYKIILKSQIQKMQELASSKN